MLLRNTIAAGLVAATALSAVPANAGGVHVTIGPNAPVVGWGQAPGYHPYWGYRRLTDRQIHWILRGHGYHNIAILDRNGPVYRVRAVKRYQTYFLLVSVRDGRVVSRQPVNQLWY